MTTTIIDHNRRAFMGAVFIWGAIVGLCRVLPDKLKPASKAPLKPNRPRFVGCRVKSGERVIVNSFDIE